MREWRNEGMKGGRSSTLIKEIGVFNLLSENLIVNGSVSCFRCLIMWLVKVGG